MRRFTSPAPEADFKRKPRTFTKIFVFVLLCLAAPPVYELTLEHASHWQRIFGGNGMKVEKPFTKYYAEQWDALGRSVGGSVTRYFNRLPWRASNVVFVGAILAVSGTLMLRKRT